MDRWGLLMALVALGGALFAWRTRRVFQIIGRVDEARRHTINLHRKRHEIARQIVIFADHAGAWDHQVMERLVKAAQLIETGDKHPARTYAAEEELSLAIQEAVAHLRKQASDSLHEDVAMIEDYWKNTESKIRFANEYFYSTTTKLEGRLDRILARLLCSAGLVDKEAARLSLGNGLAA